MKEIEERVEVMEIKKKTHLEGKDNSGYRAMGEQSIKPETIIFLSSNLSQKH